MDKNTTWLEKLKENPDYQKLKTNPIAYFCAEFGLLSDIPIYAGGLGILAGDFIREASIQNFPIVGIGLYYNDGYETLHKIDARGYIEEPHMHKKPEIYGLTKVSATDGNPLIIEVPINDGKVAVQAWVWNVGKIPVYLLDTNVDSNSANDKKITDHLYVVDRESRLKQEIILGVGGAMLLTALNIKPSIYHMNEGHSSLLALTVIKEIMDERQIIFTEALEEFKKKVVFTNHTLVPGGNEVFTNDLASFLLKDYAQNLGIPLPQLLAYGAIPQTNSFSLTLLSLNFAGVSNAVSKLHAEVAKNIWREHPLIPITNGINLNQWDTISDESHLWQNHLENKRALIESIKRIKSTINWSEDDLIIGWARRLVSYKRPMALLEDVAALKSLTVNKPIRIVFAGKLHPSDIEAAETLDKFHAIIEKEIPDIAVFLPEYDMDTARLMVAGCDVWANTPIVGFEACGTSGMKAALNGSLPLSTKDGWVAEIELLNKGWEVDDKAPTESILGLLQNDILPLYYDRDENNIPQLWIQNMKNSRDLIKNEFSTTRMLAEYLEKLYLPLLNTSK